MSDVAISHAGNFRSTKKKKREGDIIKQHHDNITCFLFTALGPPKRERPHCNIFPENGEEKQENKRKKKKQKKGMFKTGLVVYETFKTFIV